MTEEVKIPTTDFADELMEAGAKTLNLCFQCGTCTGGCPSGRFTALRIRKIIRKAQLGFKEDVLPSDDLWLCTTCYTCYERCPRGVEVPDIIMTIRNKAVQSGYMAEAHKKTAKYLIKYGHMVPLTDEFKEIREKLGLKREPETTWSNKKALEEVQKIIGLTGFKKLVEGE